MRTNAYRSKFEKKIADDLTKRKVKFKYESEKLKYEVPSSNHTYTPDFVLPNGVYVEAKGILDADTRKKMVNVIRSNPDRDIRLLLMRDQPLRKGAKMKYGEWCDKNDILYAVGHVPEEWLV